MLEDMRCLWRQPALVEELGGHQLLQPALYCLLLPRGNGQQHVIRKFPPERGPKLRQPLGGPQAVQARKQRIIQRMGMASGG
jgi:hypothetical protein